MNYALVFLAASLFQCLQTCVCISFLVIYWILTKVLSEADIISWNYIKKKNLKPKKKIKFLKIVYKQIKYYWKIPNAEKKLKITICF